MNKQYKPNIVRGGIALPLGNNYYFMRGRKHNQGGIDVGKDLEVEDGEIMKVSPKEVKVFSSVPFLNGQSPVEKLLGGENPNKVFAQQERFKKVNKINDDGTKARLGKGKKITTIEIPESEQYAVTTPDGQRKVFNNKKEVQQYITTNTLKGYSLYDITNYGSNIDKGQVAILNRNTEREVEKAIEKEKLTTARLANRQQNQDIAKKVFLNIPGISDGNDLYQIAKDVYNKKYLNAGIGLGLLALPNFIEKPLKYVGKGIKRLFNKTPKKLNTNVINNIDDVNINNPSYEELAEDYADAWYDTKIKSIDDINKENLQNVTDEEWDKLYNRAIENNDLKEVQILRDLHFKAKAPDTKILDNYGDLQTIYTGVPVKFTKYDKSKFGSSTDDGYYGVGLYGSSDKRHAQIYAKDLNEDYVLPLYINMKRPFAAGVYDKNGNLFKSKDEADIRSTLAHYFNRGYKGINDNYNINKKDYITTNYPVSDDIKNDFVMADGVIYSYPNKRYDEVVIPEPEQMKFTYPITYDDNGNIIPLSKRDNFNNPDMRYNWLLPTIGVGAGLSLINDDNQYKYGGKMNDKNNIDYIYNKIDKSDKNFVKRLRDKNRKHITNWEDTTQISTHKLGVATDNKGRHYIYPEIQEINGQLIDYTRPPFNRTSGMINAEKTGDTIRINSIEDGIKFTQEYKNRYMNKKQMGGKANVYRVDSNGKTNWRMNISTGDKSKAHKKAYLGTNYYGVDADEIRRKELQALNTKYNIDNNVLDFHNYWRNNKIENTTTTIPQNTNLASLITPIDKSEIVVKPVNITTPKPKSIGLTTSDYIGLGTNLLGSIGSALINANTLDKMRYTKQPIPKIANKLKTSVNINPQLDVAREQLNKGLKDIDQNTASSATALNRKNKLRLANIMSTNQLFGNKENLETELINKDRLNQQNVVNSNIDSYNKWNENKTAFENTIKDKQAENYVSLVQNVGQGITNTLGNIEKRKQFNNNLIAILAANPNVNPEYLRALGADWITDEMIINWKRANNK